MGAHEELSLTPWEPSRGEGVSESIVERMKPVQPKRGLEQGDHTREAAPPE